MKKISEMTIEELQEYALELENKNKDAETQATAKDAKIAELTELNTSLQKRNNDLFMKVEQDTPDDNTGGEGKKEEKPESCEDFAKRLLKKE